MNRTVSLALILIVLLGGIFRVYHLPRELWFLSGTDEQRDMLVARHIVEFGEHIIRGPLASGSNNALMNSPVYYYFLAVLWFIGKNPIAVQFLWALVVSASIPIAYIVGLRMWDWKLGLIFAFFIAIHPEMVWMSRHISQPYLLPLFSLLFLSMFWKRRITAVTIGIACFLLILPLHFHYGSLLLIPGGGAWLLTRYINRYKKKTAYEWLLPAVVAEGLLFSWVILTYRYVPFDQFRFLAHEVQMTLPSFAGLVMTKVELLRDAMWWSGWNATAIVATGIIALLAGFAYSARKDDSTFRNRYLWFAMIYVTALAFSGFNRTNANPSYLLSLVPMALLFSAVAVRTLMMKNVWVGTVGGILLLSLFLPNTIRQVSAAQTPSMYDRIRVISARIIEDYEAIQGTGDKTPQYALAAIVDNLPYDGWGTSGIWYFLEYRYKKPLVRLANAGVNYMPRSYDARFVYLLCDLEDTDSDACVRRFKSVRSYLYEGETNIYASDTHAVWRFFLRDDRPPDITHFYKDMYRSSQ